MKISFEVKKSWYKQTFSIDLQLKINYNITKMLKWNTQKQHPNNSSNNGQEVDNIFADISTRYVTDIQCAIDAKTLDDNNDSEQKVIICNYSMNN